MLKDTVYELRCVLDSLKYGLLELWELGMPGRLYTYSRRDSVYSAFKQSLDTHSSPLEVITIVKASKLKYFVSVQVGTLHHLSLVVGSCVAIRYVRFYRLLFLRVVFYRSIACQP